MTPALLRPPAPLRHSRIILAAALALAALPAALPAQSVTGFTLFDSSADVEVGPLVDSAVIDLATLGTAAINVRANTQPATIGSVRFGLDGDPEFRIENGAPYLLAGNNGSDNGDWFPSLGVHTIIATPFSGSDATGTAEASLAVTFTVIDGPGGPGVPGNYPPQVSAGPARFAIEPATMVTLDGSATDIDGSIASLEWTQVWGPPSTVVDRQSATTAVVGLTPGAVCVFRLTAIDDVGGTASADVIAASIPPSTPPGTVTGELRHWHRVTIDFDAPSTSEDATPNPFLERRLDVVFTTGDRSVVVPGFYAADGDAAESGADSGGIWRVRFAPDEIGPWSYTALFRSGSGVAIADDPGAGSADLAIHGATGGFTVLPSDKVEPDFRSEGRLDYVGEHHLRFAGSGRSFIKGGADSPENFLAYEDFDGTFDNDGTFLHAYQPHVADWQPGDPEWGGGLGHGIIGALNYLSSKGMNSVYFLTMNVGGDGDDVWPWTAPGQRTRYDSSKLDQWEIVFDHMDSLGLQLHVVLQETETDQVLDGGALGTERRLYHRELVARFSHHLALVWNIGEENTNTDAQRKLFARNIRALDPYDHPIACHTHTVDHDLVFLPLLGFDTFEMPSLQGSLESVHPETLNWRTSSAAAGRPWVVCNDENGPFGVGIVPDSVDFWHDEPRQEALWGNLMAGGGGSEWFFGGNYPNDDRNCEDWRSRDQMWNLTRYALEFFRDHLPFWMMEPADGLTSSGSDHCLALPGEVYAVYLPQGGTTSLQLPAGIHSVAWFDPRNGGALQSGSITSVAGPGSVPLGSPPALPTEDWVILVRGLDEEFLRGDCNGDGVRNIADVLRHLEWQFLAGPPLPCLDACDLNDDGALHITDPVLLLGALFHGDAIPLPATACGTDPTGDLLDCGLSGGCP